MMRLSSSSRKCAFSLLVFRARTPGPIPFAIKVVKADAGA